MDNMPMTQSTEGSPAPQRWAVELTARIRLAAGPGVDAAAYGLRNPLRAGVIKEFGASGLYFISGMRFEVGDTIDLELDCESSVFLLKCVVGGCTVDGVSSKPTYGTSAQILRNEQSMAAISAIAVHIRRRTSLNRPGAC